VSVSISFDRPAGHGDTLRWRRILVGVGISIVWHAWLLYGVRDISAPDAADIAQAPRPIAVRMQAAPPLPRPKPPARPPQAARPDALKSPAVRERDGRDGRGTPAVRAIGKARAFEPVIEPVIEPAEPIAPTLPGNPERRESAADAAPRFDPEAARKTARKFANESGPGRTGTALGQIDPQPLRTETPLARAIGSSARRDCRTDMPGGILGPLLLLLDKKDSGCKW
jgi:hypothetical protein